MQVEFIRAILQFGKFDYIDHLLLNVTTCTVPAVDSILNVKRLKRRHVDCYY